MSFRVYVDFFPVPVFTFVVDNVTCNDSIDSHPNHLSIGHTRDSNPSCLNSHSPSIGVSGSAVSVHFNCKLSVSSKCTVSFGGGGGTTVYRLNNQYNYYLRRSALVRFTSDMNGVRNIIFPVRVFHSARVVSSIRMLRIMYNQPSFFIYLNK